MGWRGPMTDRQYWAWQDWFEEDMDRPDKVCHYLMQLTERVGYVIGGDPREWNPNKWRIVFEKSTPNVFPTPGETVKLSSKEQAMMIVEALGLSAGNVKVV